MRLEIHIDLDGEAFDDNPSIEVCRILSTLMAKLSALSASDWEEEPFVPLLDVNGNKAGYAEVYHD